MNTDQFIENINANVQDITTTAGDEPSEVTADPANTDFFIENIDRNVKSIVETLDVEPYEVTADPANTDFFIENIDKNVQLIKDNFDGGGGGEGIGFGEGTRVKGVTSDVNIDALLLLDLSQTTSLKQLFADNSSEGFKNFTISNVDLSHVTDCTRMFESCTNLETVTFDNTTPSGWSPIAPNMFYNCVGLKKVILPQGFSPTNIQSFLNRCSSLTEFPQFDTSKAVNITQAFENISAHGKIKPPVYDFSHATAIQSCFGNFGRNYDPFFDGDISENVENILLSMLTMTSFTGTKQFSAIFEYTPSSTGTSSSIEMYNIITASPTYQLLLDAGWTALS